MCGINGIFGLADRDIVLKMNSATSHRGPDDSGVFVDDDSPVSLGHNRLSIIDLSKKAHQPMTDESGRFVIVFNGEVYNYKELRQILIEHGYSFKTDSDTEVVVNSYREWGKGCLERFRGMFAFAILDRGASFGPDPKVKECDTDKPYLFVARDRFGIKPFIYSHTDKGFLFSSELKGLFASSLIEKVVDNEALSEYLQTGSVYQPKTIIKGVSSLMPGSFMFIGGNKGGMLSSGTYWNLFDDSRSLCKEIAGADYEELVGMVKESLLDATKAHLVSDVPVGAFLSGGLDSTAIVALMSKFAGYPIKTFSVGFENTGNVSNELSFARIAAEHIGTDHSEVFLTGKDIKNSFDNVLSAIDQPSIDGTNTFMVSLAAGDHVKVALSGVGGDELFGGYPHFKSILNSYGKKNNLINKLFSKVFEAAPNNYMLENYLSTLGRAERVGYFRNIVNEKTYMAMVDEKSNSDFPFGASAKYLNKYLRDDLDKVNEVSLMEIYGYMENTLLRDSDVMSMYHSLEVRPIFLDHKLSELAFAISGNAKVRGGVLKSVLVDAVKDFVPQETCTRRKMGFELPFSAWMGSVLKERFLELLETPFAGNVFSEQFIKNLKEDISRGMIAKNQWSVLILLGWAQKNSVEVNL